MAWASNTVLLNTGVLVVSTGGIASNTIVLSTNVGAPGSNGALVISGGGSAVSAVISSGGLMAERGGVDNGNRHLGGRHGDRVWRHGERRHHPVRRRPERPVGWHGERGGCQQRRR